MSRWFLIAALLLNTLFIGGTETKPVELTLDRALEMALESNNQYRITQAEVRMAQCRLRQNMGFLPQVSLEGSKNLDEKLMVLEMPSMFPGGEPTKVSLDFTKNYEFTFQIVQPVFTGGKIWHNFRNARLDVKLSREKSRAGRNELILNVKKTFHNIQVLKELLQAHNESRELASRNLENISQRHELGMASRYDLLRAQLQLSATEPDILNVEKLIRLSRETLRHMVGLPPEAEVEVKGQLVHSHQAPKEEAMIAAALRNRSEIRQLSMEREKASNLLKIAYAGFLPDLSIVARYSYRSDAFRFTENNWDDYYTINLAVSFPIFTGLRRSGQVGELRVLRKTLKMRAQELDEATRLQIRNLCLTMEQEHQNVLSGEKNVETAREGVRIAELNYGEGMISILELNASTTSLTRARVGLLQSIYNHTVAAAELEKLTGVRLNGGKQ